MAERRMTLALFGAFDFRVDGSPVNLGLSGPTRSMLQYLVCCTGRLTRREQLMEMFWSGTSPERRRSSLNSAIWRIKKALRTADAPAAFAIDATAECVRMAGTRSPEVDIDAVSLADAFAAASAPGAGEADVERLLATLNGCDGTPLDGLDDDWAQVERERLEAFRLRGFSIAMRLLAQRRRYDEALDFGHRILLHDPFHECAVQEVLCIHALNGQRVRALKLFDAFSESLASELGISPMPETRALRDFLAGNGTPALAETQGEPGGQVLVHPGVDELLSSIAQSRGAVRLHS
ncbi:MAG: hypothetical protein KDK03_13045 [Rhodobacteraceae bacterium]|nr:hypothetical protein [Paracoccaceae bacterium]